MLFILVGLGSTAIGLIVGYVIGTKAERNSWIRQIKQEEELRHLSQGNAFWQK
jgi:membrane protein YqaA with SNARE-associated domain